MESLRTCLEKVNTNIGTSTFGRVFRLEGCGHVGIVSSHKISMSLTKLQDREIKNSRFTTEIRAGLTTFFTMAYVISVNVRTNTLLNWSRTNSQRPPL